MRTSFVERRVSNPLHEGDREEVPDRRLRREDEVVPLPVTVRDGDRDVAVVFVPQGFALEPRPVEVAAKQPQAHEAVPKEAHHPPGTVGGAFALERLSVLVDEDDGQIGIGIHLHAGGVPAGEQEVHRDQDGTRVLREPVVIRLRPIAVISDVETRQRVERGHPPVWIRPGG